MNWKNQGDRPEHNTHKPKQRRNQGMESADRKAGGWSKEGTEMGKWPLSNLRTRLPQAEQRTPSKANSLQLIKDATYFCFHFAGLWSTSLWGSGGAHKVDCREEKLLGFLPISQLAYSWMDKEALKQGEEDPGAVEKQGCFKYEEITPRIPSHCDSKLGLCQKLRPEKPKTQG